MFIYIHLLHCNITLLTHCSIKYLSTSINMAKNISAWKDATKDSTFLHGLVISDKNSTIKKNSSSNYIGMVRRLFQQINVCYPEMVEQDEGGVAMMHTGEASGVFKLAEPIDETKMLHIFV